MASLSIIESIALAKKYGINFAPFVHAQNEMELAIASQKTGYPLALKVVSNKHSHKTDVGGVALNIKTPQEALQAFARMKKIAGFEGVLVQEMAQGTEIIIGGKFDENFGPTILFGLGGIFVETLKDYSIRVCPISAHDAKEMVCTIKGFPILKGTRGQKGANLKLIEKELLKVNKLLLKEKQVKELDINPLFVTQKSIVAVDARIIV